MSGVSGAITVARPPVAMHSALPPSSSLMRRTSPSTIPTYPKNNPDSIAPISGRTGIRQVDEGNIVHASDATGIVVITQIRPISVFFSLPQQQLQRINKAFAQA